MSESTPPLIIKGHFSLQCMINANVYHMVQEYEKMGGPCSHQESGAEISLSRFKKIFLSAKYSLPKFLKCFTRLWNSHAVLRNLYLHYKICNKNFRRILGLSLHSDNICCCDKASLDKELEISRLADSCKQQSIARPEMFSSTT